MSSVIQFFKVKEASIDLSIKSLKSKKGHEGEILHTCNIYFGKSHIATYQEYDMGAGHSVEVNTKKQKEYDNALKVLSTLSSYYCDILRQDVSVTLEDWANEACIVSSILKTAKREKPRSYFDKIENTIRVYPKKKGTEDSFYQDHMKTMKNIIPLHTLEDEEVLKLYLKYHKIKF